MEKRILDGAVTFLGLWDWLLSIYLIRLSFCLKASLSVNCLRGESADKMISTSPWKLCLAKNILWPHISKLPVVFNWGFAFLRSFLFHS